MGEKDWPFPIPIVSKDGKWEFDTAVVLPPPHPADGKTEKKTDGDREVQLREVADTFSTTDRKDILDGITWQRGTTNLNIGDIIPNITTRLGMKGVTNLTFDPVKMPKSHNNNIMAKFEKKPADTVTLNLLDHIPDKEERLAAIQIAQEYV